MNGLGAEDGKTVRPGRMVWDTITRMVVAIFAVIGALTVVAAFRPEAPHAAMAMPVDAAMPTRDDVEDRVYWPNCRAAWAAGAAPIYEGQPGYRVDLDGDLDGIACEPIHRRY